MIIMHNDALVFLNFSSTYLEFLSVYNVAFNIQPWLGYKGVISDINSDLGIQATPKQ